MVPIGSHYHDSQYYTECSVAVGKPIVVPPTRQTRFSYHYSGTHMHLIGRRTHTCTWQSGYDSRHCRNRFGVIPKRGVNKWRLILDLSSPDGSSVNDGIRPDLCSLAYMSVDDAARASARAG